MKNIIKNHSKNFNVSEIDSKMFIESIILSLKNTLSKCNINIDEIDEETKMKFFYIALDDSTEKLNEFINQYNSYNHKRESFQKQVLNTIKAETNKIKI